MGQIKNIKLHIVTDIKASIKKMTAQALLMGVDRVPDQLGYFVLNFEGAVLSSSGELENDETSATIVTEIVRHAMKINLTDTGADEKFKRISLTYQDFVLMITVSNQKIFAVKRPIQ